MRQLTVMTFNLWRGGEAADADREASRAQTLAVLEATGADVFGLQETDRRSTLYADRLGLCHVDQGGGRSIMSRLEVVAVAPHGFGVAVRLPGGGIAHVFNVHPTHRPYQPYQLAGIPYQGGHIIHGAAEAIEEARKARGAEIAALIAALRPVLAGGEPVFLTGDFNEPSHLDWTARAADAGVCPLAVAWPSSSALAAAGMRDAYRSVFSDEVRRPGHTWTSRPAPREVPDRIDRVYFAGAGVSPLHAAVVGEERAHADVVITPWPSDHRAMLATFELGRR